MHDDIYVNNFNSSYTDCAQLQCISITKLKPRFSYFENLKS